MNMIEPTLWVLGGMAGIMLCAWLTQRLAKNAGWVDVFWTLGTGAACVFAALWPAAEADAGRQWIVAVLGAVWAVRLGGYVAYRVARSRLEDARYAVLREEWGARFQANMLFLVIPQAPATALLALSVFAAAHAGFGAIGLRDALGAAVLAIAIAGEGLADEQMRQFKRTAKHGALMDRGLWAWSRHPNYFFEWLGWLAYPVIGFDPARPESWATFAAPLVMFIVLRYGTGVPVLERIMLRSRGDLFRDYQSRVSAFFLWPPRPGKPQQEGRTS
jgi:steroid 5-alpha reductase family enzyme